jgi:hypothetical protein
MIPSTRLAVRVARISVRQRRRTWLKRGSEGATDEIIFVIDSFVQYENNAFMWRLATVDRRQGNTMEVSHDLRNYPVGALQCLHGLHAFSRAVEMRDGAAPVQLPHASFTADRELLDSYLSSAVTMYFSDCSSKAVASPSTQTMESPID